MCTQNFPDTQPLLRSIWGNNFHFLSIIFHGTYQYIVIAADDTATLGVKVAATIVMGLFFRNILVSASERKCIFYFTVSISVSAFFFTYMYSHTSCMNPKDRERSIYGWCSGCPSLQISNQIALAILNEIVWLVKMYRYLIARKTEKCLVCGSDIDSSRHCSIDL